MKTTTVADILKLQVMEGYRLAAGVDGLSKEVHYVNVYDNIPSDLDVTIPLFAGDVFLTFFYYGRGDKNYALKMVKFLIDGGASALIIFDEYISELSPELEDLCNREKLPVIFLDCHRPYSLVISSIIELRLAAEQKKSVEDKLDAITSTKTSPEDKADLIFELNSSFQNRALAFFIQKPENAVSIDILGTLNRSLLSFAADYRSGVLLINSFPESRENILEKIIDDSVNMIRYYWPGAAMGISNACNTEKLDKAILQAIIAAGTCQPDSGEIIRYRELGITRLLSGLLGSSALEEFYNDVTKPILRFDMENNSCLFDTMLMFAAHNMDYKETAVSMFVHENTIRYRINRLKEMIPYGKSDMDFYETISVTAKIHKLKHL